MAGIFSYAKTLWQDGVTAITAARLNHIEQGISDAADSIKTLGDSVCQRSIIGNSGEGGIITKDIADWLPGLYFLFSYAPYQENATVLQTFLVKAKDGKCYVSASENVASINGTVLTVQNVPWYSAVHSLQLMAIAE